MNDIHKIIELTAQKYEVTPNDILGVSRKQPIMEARQVAMWLAKQKTPFSLERIGTYFSGHNRTTKGHSTVRHSVKTIDNAIDVYPHKKQFIHSLLDQLC